MLEKTLALIAADPKITYDRLAGLLGRKRETVRVYIKRLRTEYRLIERVGAAKNGHWAVSGRG